MNTDARVKKLLGQSALHGDSQALSDLTSIWGTYVESNNALIVQLVHYYLDIAVAVGSCLVISPL